MNARSLPSSSGRGSGRRNRAASVATFGVGRMQTSETTDNIAPAASPAPTPARPLYAQLWFLVLVAMAIGVVLGKFYPDAAVRMEPLGNAFIKAIRVLIAPIIFCTVVHGISSMADMAKVGRVALKALIYFEALTTIALVVGLVAVNLLAPARA
jgi:aerobic C4-dicarboxylate transport protein